ncbi:hypothetical protein ACFWN5_38200 [Streptomyces sp. NPDC058430]
MGGELPLYGVLFALAGPTLTRLSPFGAAPGKSVFEEGAGTWMRAVFVP